MGRPSPATACALIVLLWQPAARADAPAPVASPQATQPAQPALSRYLQAIDEARLSPQQSATAAQLRALVAEGERLHVAGHSDEAAILLLEAVESPRFANFHDFEEYVAAEHMAGAALFRLGALKTARIYLGRTIDRGPKGTYYGPSVRSYVDVALRLGDLQAAADWLAQREPAMTEDARGELAYLRARSRYDAGDFVQSAQIFEGIGKRSRFHANAQYFLGVIAARAKQYKHAEARFCAVASQGVEDHYSFYVDERFFAVQDLARLALGRTAHEQGRGDDAFYYYFQVPGDSPRLAAALFEAAYAAYEAKDHDNALDLLDQLEKRFPDSAFVDEAGILRGYVALARCDFELADRHFSAFGRHFEPLLAEIERLLQNPVRRTDLYDELLEVKAGKQPHDAERRTLLSLLRVDPDFYRLHAALSDLDAEAARDGRLSDALSVLLVRLQGGDRPRAAAAEPHDPPSAGLERDLGLAVASVRSLGEQLDMLRSAGAKPGELAAREQELSALGGRVQALQERARMLQAKAPTETQAPQASGPGLAALLTSDVAFARRLPTRTAAVRARLVHAASHRAEQALRELRARLDGLLRRAHIGRIDAVMGSKRRIELQIESLAAGRFPAELRDPLAVQGLLADDEEYWPFEGEDWPDEYQERYESKSKSKSNSKTEPAAPSGVAR
jgi:hypothetical protein